MADRPEMLNTHFSTPTPAKFISRFANTLRKVWDTPSRVWDTSLAESISKSANTLFSQSVSWAFMLS